MTTNRIKSIVQVIFILSVLSAVQLAHFYEPAYEGVSSGSSEIPQQDSDPFKDISDTLVDEDEQEFDFPLMDLGHFTENRGQWESHIRFLAKTSFGSIGLGDGCVFYYVSNVDGGHVVKVTFHDAEENRPYGRESVGFSSNYFIGNDHEMWAKEAGSFEEVLFEDVWFGIDILYFFKNGNLKYDIVVDEQADPDLISFDVQGHSNLDVGEDKLVISIAEGVFITDSDLRAFYDDGTTETVRFKKLADNCYGFDVDKVDGKKLIIDPMVFSSSTFLGGSKSDQARDMELDSNGDIIILGDTMSLDFPNTTGAYETSNTGSMDIVITKMDPNATYLIFSTYIGGWSYDFPYALDVDSNGDIYVTGETWARDFPTTNGSYSEESPTGSTNVFVLKLSSSGSDLIYSTYVGSTSADWARDIKVLNGYAYVVGYTYSYDFPYVDYPINNAHGTTFFFILNQDASNLTHTAFWGGYQNEIAYSMAIDTNDDVVVGGITNSMDFPVTSGAYMETPLDWNNGFLLRYRPSTSTLLFSTYIGGTALEEIRSICLAGNSDIYFSGITNNPGESGKPFPTTLGAYDTTLNGSKDAFIGKMSSDGSNLLYSTFLGSEGDEQVGSIDIDSQGNVYFTGSIDSDVNFSVTPDAFDDTFNNDSEVLFAVMNADLSDVLYSTYLGGIGSDLGKTCLLAAADEILLLGTTSSTDFPSTSNSFQSQNNGTGVMFITKFVIGNFIFLHEGWNLISVPLVPVDTNLYSVLSSISGNYDAVQWFDFNSGSWKHTHITKPSHLNTLQSIDHKMGFWIHITEPGGVLFEYLGNPPGFTGIISLKTGWNAVGYPASGNMQRDMALNTLTFGLEVDSIWYYDSANQTWRAMGSSDYFVLGRGYWFHATQECAWVVP
jgi:hypothetical protein